MALMLIPAARLDDRLDHRGCILLMKEQDRSKWDARLIERGKQFLDQSSEGTVVSTYHLEAGIALHYCSARSYAETDWPAILRLYDALLGMHASPIYVLNRAIVVAEIDGPAAGIQALEQAGRAGSLSHYHLYDATLGELYRRLGDFANARRYLETAKQKTTAPSDHEIINRRLAKCT